MGGGYKIIRQGATFSVEGFFRNGNTQRFSAASGFKTEAEARAWVYEQQAKNSERNGETGGDQTPSRD